MADLKIKVKPRRRMVKQTYLVIHVFSSEKRRMIWSRMILDVGYWKNLEV